MSGSFNKTSPNAYGGSFGYDPGISIGGKDPNTRTGDSYNAGHPLHSEKGQWDDELEYLENEENFDSFELDLGNKSPTSLRLFPNDSLNYKGVPSYKGSFGNLGNGMAAVLSHHERNGSSLLESYIKSVISELGISGNIAVQSRPKAKNLGGKYNKVYHLDTNDLGSMGMTNGSYIGGEYKSSGKDTTDGAETVNLDSVITQYIQDMILFNSGDFSTSEIFYKDFDKQYMDNINLSRLNK